MIAEGKAVGWRSTLANLIIDEAIFCFTKAIENATEEKQIEIKPEINNEITQLSLAVVKMCMKSWYT